MKTLSKILTTCFCIILCFSCSKNADEIPNEVIQEISEQNNQINNKYLTDFLERSGLKGSQIQSFKDGYLIDGDIYVSDESLIERYESVNSTSKRGSENLQTIADSYNQVSYLPGVTRTVTYLIGSSVPSVWEIAIEEAFNEWNNVKNLSLNFVESSSSTADITFGTYYEESLTIGFADFPLNGDPGDDISINTYHNTRATASQKKFAMAHEIGHALGFRHTDWEQRGEQEDYPGDNVYGANLIAGTWNYDEASVMNAVVDSWQGFSFLDILAFRTVYPLEDNLKPCYVYQRIPNKGYYWTYDWSEYGYDAYDPSDLTGYEYLGFNGFIYTTQVSGTVPIYLYYNPTTHLYNKSKDPYIDSNFPGWDKVKIMGYAYDSDGPGRQPVHQYYHPDKGFFNTLNYDSDFTSSDPNWSYSGIAYYAASIY